MWITPCPLSLVLALMLLEDLPRGSDYLGTARTHSFEQDRFTASIIFGY
jgi:hypothetical protein